VHPDVTNPNGRVDFRQARVRLDIVERNQGLKTIGALVATFIVLLAIWLSLGGFRETSEQPFPARTAGQTLLPSQTNPSPTDDTGAPTATGDVDLVSGLPWVALTDLPPEVAMTLDAIEAGPPYPYDGDGATFENREGLLPDEESGYYQEFTVTTPGATDRGARRVVWGLEDEFYYTDDHYESFSRIMP
jgi:ribonuclease T1